MDVRNIEIKAKKISELDNLINKEKIADSYIIVSYTENGAKENYKLRLQNLIDSVPVLQSDKEYSINIYTNNASLVSQTEGPYIKNTIVTLKFNASENHKLTDSSCFLINAELLAWIPKYGKLIFKIDGTGNPIINIVAESLVNYIINYSGLTNMFVNIPKLSYEKNEELVMTLTPYVGYELPNSINDFMISGGELLNYDKTSGELRIRVNDNIIISGSAIGKPKYNVNVNIKNTSYIINPNSTTFYKDEEFIITISPNLGYVIADELNIENGTLINYRTENNNIIVTIKVNGTGPISISGAISYKEIPFIIHSSNLTYVRNADQPTYYINDTIKITMTPVNGYVLPKISNIILSGCTIVSYETNELIIKISGNDIAELTINGEVPDVIETYYFGMTYAGEGYFNNHTILASTGESLNIFEGNDNIDSIESPYISSSISVSPIPYNNFNINNYYQNVFYIPKFTFVSMLIPKKYVIENNNSYLFLDDYNNRYTLQQFGIDITNFEQLRDIYEDDNINWNCEVTIGNVPHYLLYFKDEGTAGEYKFEKIS